MPTFPPLGCISNKLKAADIGVHKLIGFKLTASNPLKAECDHREVVVHTHNPSSREVGAGRSRV